MTHFEQYLYDNRVAIETFVYLFASAGIVTMPEEFPHSMQTIWTWLRDWLHQFLNLRKRPSLEGQGKEQ